MKTVEQLAGITVKAAAHRIQQSYIELGIAPLGGVYLYKAARLTVWYRAARKGLAR